MVFLCPYNEEDIKDIAQRAARDEDGDVYYVPDDMTYQEWKSRPWYRKLLSTLLRLFEMWM